MKFILGFITGIVFMLVVDHLLTSVIIKSTWRIRINAGKKKTNRRRKKT